MWSYYGRKHRIAKYYPNPIHDTIIEPFAGTAAYSLYKDNWKKEVVLVDNNPIIIDIWHYLQSAKPTDILNLPSITKIGEDIRNNKMLSKEEKYLMGFQINYGVSMPRNKVTKWAYIQRQGWENKKLKIAQDLYKIKHWKIILGSYIDITNIKATWFIDPPYQFGGQAYRGNSSNKFIDYDELTKWCKSRKGQVIICENSKADWMDFKFLVKTRSQTKEKQHEMIWTNK